ncbi:MAG: hypothetical protein H0W02_18210 [Ktedonobacteraceae bacterium]|nr:hypothetical protein [Ktedonobacteraceae bacterium]
MGKRFLVALDTDHIKQYVFATDMLKEIRGASSILDDLNRRAMIHAADAVGAKIIYANGGSGQFVLQSEEALKNFAQRIQHAYREQTRGGASIAVATQEIPATIPDEGIENNAELHPYLRLLQYRLLQAKGYPHHDSAVLPSHPLMRLCDSCGTRYAEDKYKGEGSDPEDQQRRYCTVCLRKRREDYEIKHKIEDIATEWTHTGEVTPDDKNPFAWEKLIDKLPEGYRLPVDTDRPSDFNKFQRLSNGYLALIYADANSMGEIMDKLLTINEHKDMAEVVDSAIYAAMSAAIAAHLPVVEGDGDTPWMFPFDILMIGGDDILIVTPADVALDVALTLAKTFHEETKTPDKEACSLAIGVVLAPVKYPFGLLQDLAETTLKFAKRTAAKNALQEATAKDPLKTPKTNYRDTLINFMTVTGSNSLDFSKVYDSLHEKDGTVDGRDTQFYATLRPYTVEQLTELLNMIREGKQKGLGRTKLHQVREAVLRMNLTTSVSEGLAVLSNWRGQQREFVVEEFYKWANGSQKAHRDVEKPETLFPRVTFPWFADGPDIYRTFLLDFVELYDFVGQKEVEDGQ